MQALTGGRGRAGPRRGAWLLAALALTAALPGCSLLRPPEEGPAPPPPAPPERTPLPTTSFDLPADQAGNMVGEIQVVKLRAEDTFIDVAQAYHLGYDELVEANPGVDPWLPGAGTLVVLPSRFVLPDAPRQGIVLNVASKRLFYYPKPKKGEPARVYTFPISIGREGWATPLGRTRVVSKKKDPVWRVPVSIRREHAENGDPLPAVVPPGPDNPLGKYAMRLAIPGDYLIHGTNKPAGVGMRVSHGCIRMNPDDIEWLFPQVPVGLPVFIVNQPLLVGQAGAGLYLEAHPGLEEDKQRRTAELLREIGKRLPKGSATAAGAVDYERVASLASSRIGFPVSIMAAGPDLQATIRQAPRVTNVVTYDWFSEGDDGQGGGAASPPAPASR